ncbi:MoaD/ThiS family protein [Sphingomonas arenae]|uniref:MoaD/ThiS family protein n=1 Tax=Sphingomonas arenae TaxID=2812555 RepID=UPI0019683E91|nr:MoaD/ThiS family protein [Sphingomonas arenae]
MDVRLYGRLADMLGRELRLEVPGADCSVAEVRSRIAEEHPQSREHILSSRVRACVGDTLVSDTHRLKTSEALEFFPPVSGG